METRPPMSSDNLATTGPTPETLPAETLGMWVATLAEDALRLADVSLQFAPGAPLRAPFRAGLRHLLHIVPLSQGIEALAMLEVSIMLRVTALLATPAEELDSETVIRLRADTPLIEELFPEEKDVIWQFCHDLIEAERKLPSEQSVSAATELDAASDGAVTDGAVMDGDAPTVAGDTSSRDGALDAPVHEDASKQDGGTSHDGAVTSDGAVSSDDTSNGEEAASSDEAVDFTAGAADAGVAAIPEPVSKAQPADAADELIQRLRGWASGYRAPQFGGKPYDLTRARAFVRTRVNAWAGH